jgi:hypothetical protein
VEENGLPEDRIASLGLEGDMDSELQLELFIR